MQRSLVGKVAAGLLLGGIAFAGCQLEPAAPGSPTVLRLESAISAAEIPVGESATLTIQVHNPTARPVTAQFRTGCQVTPYITTPTGAPVYPGPAGWACTQGISALRLEPEESRQQIIIVRGASSEDVAGSSPALAPGRYRAHAELRAADGTVLVSRSVTFSVVP